MKEATSRSEEEFRAACKGQSIDKHHYIESWTWHINELTKMYSALSVEDMNELGDIRGRLHELVVNAADREYPEPE